MGLPKTLSLLRHAESEGNLAIKLSKSGDHSLFTEEMMKRHSSGFHLTNKGIEQAKIAGEWVRKNIGLEFAGYYVSVYFRALETAAHLQLPFANWRPRIYLKERDWGELDVVSQEEKETKYKESMEERERDGVFWRPPNGESMANICMRVDRVMREIEKEFSGKDVIIVCHGETMIAFRIVLEGLPPWEYKRLMDSPDKKDKILNCQILQYTREDPLDPKSKKMTPKFGWMRSVCPTDMSLSSNIWTPIVRKEYSNQELLAIASQTPRLIE